MKLAGFGLQVRSRVNEENFHVKFASAFAIPRRYLLHNLSITRNAKKLYIRHDLKKPPFLDALRRLGVVFYMSESLNEVWRFKKSVSRPKTDA
jgi:hypothetical protein